jgi:hypothetical protein
MTVVWTLDAFDTFQQNLDYLSEEWSQSVIENFIQKTNEAIETIERNPLLYPISHKRKKVRKCPVVKQISLF